MELHPTVNYPRNTFITLGAQSIEARNAAIRAIFPKGSLWLYLKSGDTYRVQDHNPHGSIVLGRLSDGHLFSMWPHEENRNHWQLQTP
jgi:hypothetical protein